MELMQPCSFSKPLLNSTKVANALVAIAEVHYFFFYFRLHKLFSSPMVPINVP